MRRRLAELDRADAGRGRTVRGPRGDLGRRLTAGALAVALTATVVAVIAYKQFGVTLTSEGLRVAEALGTPPEVRTGVGSFAFLGTQPGSDRPVAYDPCRPVEYLVNDSLAPSGGEKLLRSALAEISAATGLVFVAAGTTSALPEQAPAAMLTRREPVIIAWTTPQAVPDLAGRTAGVAGSTARGHDDTGERQYLTGMVALDAPQLERVLSQRQGRDLVRAIIVHELGHLVGLDHVDDPGELMHADNVGRLSFGPGDREGLAALGSGCCFH